MKGATAEVEGKCLFFLRWFGREDLSDCHKGLCEALSVSSIPIVRLTDSYMLYHEPLDRAVHFIIPAGREEQPVTESVRKEKR